jgi:hypothetical protein
MIARVCVRGAVTRWCGLATLLGTRVLAFGFDRAFAIIGDLVDPNLERPF